VGLLTDSSVTVVASMLVSPLMGPILGISFGYLIDDKRMMWKCIRNEIIGLLITFATGFLCGAFALLSSKSQKVTTQMSSRGSAIALIAGAVVAAPSGVGVALSVANTNINSLVGVAISAALLPPVVNSGSLNIISFATLKIETNTINKMISVLLVFAFHKDDINLEAKDYLYSAAGISMVLFLMNWIIIFIFSVATFLLKGITRYEMGAHKAVWDGRVFVERSASASIRNGSIAGREKYNNRDLGSPFLQGNFGNDPLQSPFRFGSGTQGASARNPSYQPVTVSSEDRESGMLQSPDSSKKARIINQGCSMSLESNDCLVSGGSERTSDKKQLK